MSENQNPKAYNIFHSLLVGALIIVVAIIGEKYVNRNSIQSMNEAAMDESGAQFAKIYDNFWNLLNDNYYREDMDNIDWQKMRQIGLEKARTAKSRQELYENIIQKQIDLFPVSHLSIFPSVAATKNKAPAFQNSMNEIYETSTPIGVGIVGIKRGTKRIKIIDYVRPNSPAQNAGLKPGLWVKNFEIIQTPKQSQIARIEIVDIKADKMTPILDNNGALIAFSDENSQRIEIANIKSDIVDIPFQTAKTSEPIWYSNINGIEYFRLDDFMDEFVIDDLIAKFKTCPANGMIIDLRNNSGGDLELMQKFISPLLPPHTLLMHTKTRAWSRTFHSSWFFKQCSAPLSVLIGPSSASAAEIVAASLKHYNRAKIIGRRTNGSVIGAQEFVLKDGSLLQIPTLELFGADKKSIEGKGVAPDIEIYAQFNDKDPAQDEIVQRAIYEMQHN